MKNKVKYLVLVLILSYSALAQKEIKIKLKPERAAFVNCFRIKEPFKTKTGYYSKKGLFFQITLEDFNFNNKYNDIRKDRINIQPKKIALMRFQEGASHTLIRENNYIHTENQSFKITYIDSLGNYIKLKKVETIPTSDLENNIVKMVDRLPNLEFTTIDDSTHNFREFIDGKKYIFVEF